MTSSRRHSVIGEDSTHATATAMEQICVVHVVCFKILFASFLLENKTFYDAEGHRRRPCLVKEGTKV